MRSADYLWSRIVRNKRYEQSENVRNKVEAKEEGSNV